ncbi:MAG: AAA family ATPase [Methanobacteriota archaeon]
MALQVIGIVGLPGSGKTAVAKAIVDFNVPRVRMGDVVWGELKRQGQNITEAKVGELSNEFRKKEGMGAIAKRCVPLIESRGKEKRAVVVDGIRGIAEVDEFRKAFGKNFHLICTWASQKTRYQRISSRKRADDTITRESFQEKDLRELSWGMGDAIALSDFIILNEGSIAMLRKRSGEIVKKIVGDKV